jgi:hypothetical protein
MYLSPMTPAQLDQAREAVNFLLGLPVRLDPDLVIKLDTFRADVGAAIEDHEQDELTTRLAAKSD